MSKQCANQSNWLCSRMARAVLIAGPTDKYVGRQSRYTWQDPRYCVHTGSMEKNAVLVSVKAQSESRNVEGSISATDHLPLVSRSVSTRFVLHTASIELNAVKVLMV